MTPQIRFSWNTKNSVNARYVSFILVILLLAVGCQGSPGEPGPMGPQGVQGEQGEKGVSGPQGLTGSQGTPGEKGDTGSVGPRGLQGGQGEKGDTGSVGPRGLRGEQGEKGVSGPQVPTGSQGTPGKQGEPGERGERGEQGIQGERGPRGLQGAQGPREDTGARGSTGSIGPRGPTGLTDDQGPTGPTGPRGGPDYAFEDFIATKRNAVVAIFEGNQFVGSGVRISDTEVLTAAHVVTNQSSVNLSVKGEGLVFGQVRGYDSDRDVALITFTGTGGGETLAFDGFFLGTGSDGELYNKWEIGSEIAIVGYISSISTTTPIICYGRISVIWNIVPGDYVKIQTDACSEPGMSGSPVLNRHGDLIGIHLSRSQPLSRFLSVGEIEEVLTDLRAGIKQ